MSRKTKSPFCKKEIITFCSFSKVSHNIFSALFFSFFCTFFFLTYLSIVFFCCYLLLLFTVALVSSARGRSHSKTLKLPRHLNRAFNWGWRLAKCVGFCVTTVWKRVKPTFLFMYTCINKYWVRLYICTCIYVQVYRLCIFQSGSMWGCFAPATFASHRPLFPDSIYDGASAVSSVIVAFGPTPNAFLNDAI